jgi:anti-anti-sigma regulatory factor
LTTVKNSVVAAVRSAMGPAEHADAETWIRLEGTLDGFAARRVEIALERAAPGARFRIDLTQVREFHDFGIAVLGQALTRCAARVRVRGLRLHHVRVLRAFGIDAALLERDVVGDVADAA